VEPMWNVLLVVSKGETYVWFGEFTKINNGIENQIGVQTQVYMNITSCSILTSNNFAQQFQSFI
jgi:hypothetical protein